MSYNVSSSKIHVFPLAKNRASDRSGRLFYEDNIANIIRQVVDKDGFIITQEPKLEFILSDSDTPDTDSSFYNVKVATDTEMNIYGYFVRLIKDAIIYQLEIDSDNKSWELYATIEVDEESKELLGQDVDGKYSGVVFTTEIPKGVCALHLCTITTSLTEGGDREFTTNFDGSSFVKFNPESLTVSIKRIDGKH